MSDLLCDQWACFCDGGSLSSCLSLGGSLLGNLCLASGGEAHRDEGGIDAFGVVVHDGRQKGVQVSRSVVGGATVVDEDVFGGFQPVLDGSLECLLASDDFLLQ